MYGYPGDENAGTQILQPSLADAIRAVATGSIGPEDFHAVGAYAGALREVTGG